MTNKEILEAHKDERQKVQTMTRTMGYYRPIESFNKGKQGEFKERVMFTEPTCCSCGK